MHRNCCFHCKNKQSKNEFLLSIATKTCQSTKHLSVTKMSAKQRKPVCYTEVGLKMHVLLLTSLEGAEDSWFLHDDAAFASFLE